MNLLSLLTAFASCVFAQARFADNDGSTAESERAFALADREHFSGCFEDATHDSPARPVRLPLSLSETAADGGSDRVVFDDGAETLPGRSATSGRSGNADSTPSQDPQEEEKDRRVLPEFPQKAPQDWTLEWAPEKTLYRPYLADPRQAHSGVKTQFPIRADREDSPRTEMALGGYRALASWTNPNDPDVEMQLVLEGAVFSRFDLGEGGDLDGADYRFGFPFLYRDGDVTIKFHLWHLTSHMGDEIMERENRKRESYGVNEVSAGISWIPSPPFRVYAELGVALDTSTATDNGRVQVGGEWIGEPWLGKLAPFAALDLSSRNEIEWGVNSTAQFGLMLRREDKANGPRLHLEYYRGHDQQTQFKSDLQHYISIGVAADF